MQDKFRRAFLYGDLVRIPFFVHAGNAVMTEESYFFAMSCMRKMRMNIPLDYTLEFFLSRIQAIISENNLQEGRIVLNIFREDGELPLQKQSVGIEVEVSASHNIFLVEKNIELDILKEISVNTHILSTIPVHSPENIYAEIYAQENDLDDVILLNPSKRIARTSAGNLLLLQGNDLIVPKNSEGAMISPLLENFVTFIHKNNLANLREAEINPFETQKAEELLVISDFKGIFSVKKIRNKEFSSPRFSEFLEKWAESFT